MNSILIFILILIIPTIAQIYVSASYSKYKKILNKQGVSGFEVARKILDSAGLKDVHIVETPGNLSDHYDPKRKVVRLSPDIFHKNTVASMAIAAHECGHAIQDKDGYFFMRIRALIFPIVKFGTSFSYIVLLIGLLAELSQLILLGIILVGLGFLFQLITLPVEFNATSRAKKKIQELRLTSNEEYSGVSTMLTSAALTYVAGVLASALDILRLIIIFTNDR